MGSQKPFWKELGNTAQEKQLLIRSDNNGEIKLVITFKDWTEYIQVEAFLFLSDIITFSTSAEVTGVKKIEDGSQKFGT